METPKTEPLAVPPPAEPSAFTALLRQTSEPIFAEQVILKAMKDTLAPRLFQAWMHGQREHPFNLSNAKMTMLAVNIQQVCIQTKRDAIVGLGFVTDKEKEEQSLVQDTMRQALQPGQPTKPGAAGKPVAAIKKAVEDADDETGSVSKVCQVLDEFCEHGFQSVLDQVGEDYCNTGQGYLEIIREDGPGSNINAIWFMPSELVHVYIEKDKPHYHYVVNDSNGELRYARAGDLEGFLQRNPDIKQQQVTELLSVCNMTGFDPFYGVADWLSLVPWLELAQMLIQYNFDFFQNRAVPEIIALFLGRKLPEADFNRFADMLKGTAGAGNNHKSIAMNITDPEMKVHIEKLTGDTREKFGELWATIEASIVSGHRVPALLAGIQTPGKMAAANELPNALLAFQVLYVDRHQKIFRDRLRKFFVAEKGLGLTDEDFTFRRIIDYFDLGKMDTMARMRETAPEAAADGREMKDGLKD